MKRRTKRSILFIDFSQIINGGRHYDFFELSKMIWAEFDEIKSFVKVPREKESADTWGLIRVAASAGLFPTLYPSGVDPFLNEEIDRVIMRNDIKKIAVLSGDQGFFGALLNAKKKGFIIKIILPSDNASRLLRIVADEMATIDDYASGQDVIKIWDGRKMGCWDVNVRASPVVSLERVQE